MMTKNDGDVVVLVKVSPYGIAEDKFMDDLKKIKEDFGVVSETLMLGSIFGMRYNQYVLDFETEEKMDNAFDWLRDYFYQMTIENDFDNEPMLPEVIYARRRSR